ncbi:glycosyltransferase [Rufibacter sp. LB8]|uniref:glycosyltransferase n=1 Tax=Rufibacter sp. LB8 TaxID=2777781 RepID=UPI00178C33BD|nr:glycosyltransferase [Rufibacter sp. LB8]
MLFSIGFFALYFPLFLALLWLWAFRKKQISPAPLTFPKISILIAARNEEEHILTCLAAIDRLNYPKDQLQVLVGDDRSTDATAQKVKAWQKDHSYVTCISVTHDLPGTKGKANVLAQLAHHATGEFFFITDADIEVPPTWVTALLQQVQPHTGIVTGITTTKGHRLFDRLQALDWLYNLGLMQVVADRGVPVSTMGNNMLVTREAYQAAGGFENIPFSVTEDVQLFREVIVKGFGTSHVYAAEALALSLPAPNFFALLHQRRRWMRGSVKLPWYMLLLFVVHASYYPVWLPFFLHSSLAFMGAIFLAKLLLQSCFVYICARRVNWKTSVWDILLLEPYLLFTSLILILGFFLPFKIKWKGRYY